MRIAVDFSQRLHAGFHRFVILDVATGRTVTRFNGIFSSGSRAIAVGLAATLIEVVV